MQTRKHVRTHIHTTCPLGYTLSQLTLTNLSHAEAAFAVKAHARGVDPGLVWQVDDDVAALRDDQRPASAHHAM